MAIRYQHDFYGWTQEQADLLHMGMLEPLDTEHLLNWQSKNSNDVTYRSRG